MKNSMREFLPCHDGWYLVGEDDQGMCFEPIIAWQRMENSTNLAGGKLLPVSSGGHAIFDDREALKVPSDRLEWDGKYYYRLKKTKK